MYKILALLIFILPSLAFSQHEHHHHMHKGFPTPSPIDPKLFEIKESVLKNSCKDFQDGLIVSFLKVGLGDSILITCPGGKNRALIDAGDSNEQYPEAENLFYTELLKRLGSERKIKTVINTHPHFDHTYNFLSLFSSKRFEISQYVDNGGDYIPGTLEEKIRELTKPIYVDAFKTKPKTLDICPEVKDFKLEFVWLSDDSYEELGCPQNLNDCSLIYRITYQGSTILLLGDASEGWERKALREGKLKKETVVKIGHHGSLVSVYPQAWEVMKPELAVLTVGEPGKGRSDELGYPAEETINELIKIIPKHDKNSEINACLKVGIKCDWKTLSAPIRATEKRSVDLYFSKGKYCENYFPQM